MESIYKHYQQKNKDHPQGSSYSWLSLLLLSLSPTFPTDTTTNPKPDDAALNPISQSFWDEPLLVRSDTTSIKTAEMVA